MIDLPVIHIANDVCASGLTTADVKQQLPGIIATYKGKEARGWVAQMQQLAKAAGHEVPPAPDLNMVTVHNPGQGNVAYAVVYLDGCVVGVAKLNLEMLTILMQYKYAAGDENRGNFAEAD